MLKKLIYSLWLLIMVSSALMAAPQQPIPVDKAFYFKATVKDPNTITIKWTIAPGYHLYKDRISYKILSPKKAKLGVITLPPGIATQDDILGKYEIYNSEVAVDIPLLNAKSKKVTMWICYQGCADDNFCYPPETKQITLNLNNPNSFTTGQSVLQNGTLKSVKVAEQDKITQLLDEHSIWLILISFLGFGLLLSFTPCVLPMIPILSGIIVGHGQDLTTRKAFTLSLVYVLAMSFTYAGIGIIAGFAGGSLQTAFQQPWVIILFSAVFVALAFSLFGFYELQLPQRFNQKISEISNKQKSGTYLGVFTMGILSTLIVSPCVTAPLVGALAYIGNTGNALLGGSALFAMGFGMGIPLLAIGTSHGKLLPKSGPWMDNVKAFFGVLLLAVAILMLSRVIPGQITMFLWAGLLIVSSIYMGWTFSGFKNGWDKFKRGLGLLIAIYGIILLVGASMGNTDPLLPLEKSASVTSSLTANTVNAIETRSLFTPIKSNDDFDKALDTAVANKQFTMIDFYADWCIACKEMDKKTFSNSDVQQLMKKMKVLQADVTANDLTDKALMERLRVIAPPTILFFDAKGNELKAYRIVGEMGPVEFAEHLEEVLSRY